MKTAFSLIVVSLCFQTAVAWGQAPLPPVPAEDVSSRLNQLENETQTLRAEVQRLRENPVRLPAVTATTTSMTMDAAPAPAPDDSEYFTMDEIRGEMKKLVWKKGDFSIVPYGIIWTNMVYSTSRTTPGTYTLFVQSASTNPENECIADIRNTRLGTDVGGPPVTFFGEQFQTGGKVEIDFQSISLNNLAGENKATVMMRHAYAEVKNEDWRLLFGQTWDVISPLYPGTVLFSVGWDAGDIGYRRAQIRGERYLAFSDTSLVTAQLAAAPQVFADNLTSTSKVITGEPTGWPIMEGRVAWTVGDRCPGGLPITVGVSGHIGEQEFDMSGLTGDINNHRRTWSGNMDVRIPITARMGVQAEVFTGENLSSFLGGIGQGIDTTTLDTIRSSGGWFEVWYDWTPRLHSHVGYSVDDPNDQDLVTASARKYNQFYFGNITYDWTKSFLVGFEVSSWRTLYVNQLPGEAVRCEFVAKYGF